MSHDEIQEYNKKRNFSKTPEPKGLKSKSSGALRFVVQKHNATRLHYDFRLEMDGVLKSWAIPKGPTLDSSTKRLAMRTEDHPISYINFEGIIPKGNYGAGEVIVWDKGTYELFEKTNINEGEIKFRIFGKKLQGEFVLVRTKNSDKEQWLLIKHNDSFAQKNYEPDDISVISGRSLESLNQTKNHTPFVFGNDPMPHDIKPMLATLTDKPFDKKDWIFEIKWDGYRAIAEISDGEVELYSRNGISFNKDYKKIVETLKSISGNMILDGEIVILNEEGKSNFGSLQEYRKTGKGNLAYVVFDILFLNGKDLRSLPLIKRKQFLSVLGVLPNVILSEHIEENGKDFFNAVTALGIEGIIAKDGQSTYEEGKRSTAWLKVKGVAEQEAVIGGFTAPRGSRKKFGALILGVYKNGKLSCIGHTGGGFDENKISYVYEKMQPLITQKCPFEEMPLTNTPATWVKPRLVCQVKFSEWTSGGHMRQPIFLGLREDKNAEEVQREKPVEKEKVLKQNSEVKFSNLDKIYFPKEGYTKGDLINYYDNISEYIMPYLLDRPMSLSRFPNGIDGESFYQKNMETVPSFVSTIPIDSESIGEEVNYLVCKNKKTLLYMVNLGCIDINPWLSEIQNLENPDFLLIDLDPENISFSAVVKTALVLKDVLDRAGIPSYPKTSGKTGIHILIPTGAKYTFGEVKNFAHLIAAILNNKLPDITSIERSPSKRQGRVYIDYLQNRFGQTIAAPYSVRPVEKACISTPLFWEEVNEKLHPTNFTIKNIFKRLEKIGDIYKPVLGKGIDLLKSLENLMNNNFRQMARQGGR